LLRLPPLHLPNAAWVSLCGAFLLAHWGGLSWINHRRPAHLSLFSLQNFTMSFSPHSW